MAGRKGERAVEVDVELQLVDHAIAFRNIRIGIGIVYLYQSHKVHPYVKRIEDTRIRYGVLGAEIRRRAVEVEAQELPFYAVKADEADIAIDRALNELRSQLVIP